MDVLYSLQVELVHKEMAWEKEKSCIARQKLQKKLVITLYQYCISLLCLR